MNSIPFGTLVFEICILANEHLIYTYLQNKLTPDKVAFDSETRALFVLEDDEIGNRKNDVIVENTTFS